MDSRNKMPKLCQRPSPSSGRTLAYTKIDGRQIPLGPDGPEAKQRFDQVVAEWLAQGRRLPDAGSVAAGLLVRDVVADYLEHVERYYRLQDGQISSEVDAQRSAVRYLLDLYGGTTVQRFGPLALKACRAKMMQHGLTRPTTNAYVRRIRQCFRWAVAQELVPPAVLEGLRAVDGLKKGRSDAQDPARVLPVSTEHMEAVLPFVSEEIAAMIKLAYFSGMRPQEVTRMRMCEIDRSQETWLYRPESHKLQHHGIDREIVLGPRAQEVLRPFLRLDPGSYIFSPQQAEVRRNERRSALRKLPNWPSHDPERRRHRRASTNHVRDKYDVASFRRAIARACRKAAVPIWSPNQLRHAAATRIRREVGLEAAQAVLGHKFVETTQIYAEVSRQRAIETMRKLG